MPAERRPDRADSESGTVYQSDAYVSGTESTPFSGQGLSGNLTGGLPQRYARQEYYDNCLNGIGPAPAAFSPPSSVGGARTTAERDVSTAGAGGIADERGATAREPDLAAREPDLAAAVTTH